MAIGIRNEKSEVMIMATHMPYRKKTCLTVRKGNVETKYATFNNDEAATEFMKILADFIIGIDNDEVSE